MPYFGHRHSHRYLHPPSCVTVYASRREFTTKQQSSFRRALASSLKRRPTSRPVSHPTPFPSLRGKHRSVVRRSERRRRRYLKIRLRRLGVADRGVASDAPELAGVAAARGGARGASMLRVCRIVHLPPHPSRVGGWMGGWHWLLELINT